MVSRTGLSHSSPTDGHGVELLSLHRASGPHGLWCQLAKHHSVEEDSLKVRHPTGTSDTAVWGRVRKMGLLLSIRMYSLPLVFIAVFHSSLLMANEHQHELGGR